MTENLWFVGIGTETDGTTFINVRPFPAELWKNPKRFDYVPKEVLATYMNLEPDQAEVENDYEPKIRLIHIFPEDESAILDTLVQNALAFGGEGADWEVYELLEHLVSCGVFALDPHRFPAIMLGLSPLLE